MATRILRRVQNTIGGLRYGARRCIQVLVLPVGRRMPVGNPYSSSILNKTKFSRNAMTDS